MKNGLRHAAGVCPFPHDVHLFETSTDMPAESASGTVTGRDRAWQRTARAKTRDTLSAMSIPQVPTAGDFPRATAKSGSVVGLMRKSHVLPDRHR